MRSPRLARLALPAVLLLALGCGGGTEPNSGVVSVTVTPPDPSVTVGNTVQLSATPVGPDQAPVDGFAPFWASADSSVAVVSGDGLVTARGVGSVQIQAVVGGRSAYARVTVMPRPVATVSVAPATVTVAVGATATLQAAAADDRGVARTDRPATWTSSNDAVARVSATGVVTAVAPGTATVTATVDGVAARATVTVSATPPVGGGSRGPTADFAFACTNLICAFTDLSSDPVDAVTTWAWEFGDGVTSPHRNSDNVYRGAGSFTVKLTVTNDRGVSASVTRTVAPSTGGRVVQLVNRATGRCLSVDVVAGGDPKPSPLVARACDNRDDQRYVLPSGAGVGAVQLARYANRVMELHEVEPERHVPRAWQWHGAQYQRWAYAPTGELRNYVTNTCLTVQSDGRAVAAESCRAADTQRWEARQ